MNLNSKTYLKGLKIWIYIVFFSQSNKETIQKTIEDKLLEEKERQAI